MVGICDLEVLCQPKWFYDFNVDVFLENTFCGIPAVSITCSALV